MNIHNKVVIGDLERDYGHSSDQIGKMSTVNNTIYLSDRTTKQNQESTLLHEIIHVISHNNNLELNEQLVCILESCLYQVIKDNPEVFAALRKDPELDENRQKGRSTVKPTDITAADVTAGLEMLPGGPATGKVDIFTRTFIDLCEKVCMESEALNATKEQ